MLNLKLLREIRQISQQKLSDDIGVSRSTVAMWETGGSQPDNDSLKMLSKYFNVSIDYLVGYAVEPREIAYARSMTKELYETSPELTCDKIENVTKTKYATFRAWYNGYGDYFNDKLYLIADLFNVSVDYLLGRTDTPSSQTESKEWNPTFDNYLKLDPFSKTRVDQYVEILLEENQIKNIKIVESDRGQVAAFGGGLGTPEKTESHLTEEDVRKLIEEYIDKD